MGLFYHLVKLLFATCIPHVLQPGVAGGWGWVCAGGMTPRKFRIVILQ